ncbi:RNA-dependent DNA polymerase, partial [Candidatus Nomurabacteria bacterium]|nr:RNA-dependent DNA polymerase [Candidatus Nomurabacteria bacterium]
MILIHIYDNIISTENLLKAWQEFAKDKKKKKDVQEFQLRLMEHLFDLHFELKNKTYKHSSYQAFKINDPKPRDIHKALVRDRLLHHAIYRILYPYFDKKFIYDSYSCRIDKGTHKAVDRFRDFARIVSKNNTKT